MNNKHFDPDFRLKFLKSRKIVAAIVMNRKIVALKIKRQNDTK